MAARRHRRAIGVFSHREEVEQALIELRDSGFPMDSVSVVAKDSSKDSSLAGVEVTHQVGNKADEGGATGAIAGGTLGGIAGLLVGLGVLAIPGIGPVMLAGAGATVLATALSGGAIGAVAGGLLGALIGLGIPEEQAKVYRDRIAQGGYLVMVEGSDEDLHRAETILNRRGIQHWGVYDAPDSTIAEPQTGVRETIVDHSSSQSIDLYEERLVADKTRQKTGEIIIRKCVKTTIETVSVPVEKEHVIIQHVIPEDVGQVVTPGEASFRSGEVIRMEVYEDMPNIHKEVFVREVIGLRKEIQQEIINAEETIRREGLEVKTNGNPVVDTRNNI